MVTYLWTIQAALWAVLGVVSQEPGCLFAVFVCLLAAYAFHEGYF